MTQQEQPRTPPRVRQYDHLSARREHARREHARRERECLRARVCRRPPVRRRRLPSCSAALPPSTSSISGLFFACCACRSQARTLAGAALVENPIPQMSSMETEFRAQSIISAAIFLLRSSRESLACHHRALSGGGAAPTPRMGLCFSRTSRMRRSRNHRTTFGGMCGGGGVG